MTGAGYGLIETMRARDGRLPLLEAHLARLRRSLGALGLAAPPQDLAALARAAAGAGHRVVRLEVRAGVPAVTTRAVPPGAPPAVIVAVEPHAPYLHKSSERGVFDRALAEARRAGADDALLVTPAGYVAGGSPLHALTRPGHLAGRGPGARNRVGAGRGSAGAGGRASGAKLFLGECRAGHRADQRVSRPGRAARRPHGRAFPAVLARLGLCFS